MRKPAKNKETEKMKLRRALEYWPEERCAAVLRFVALMDHPPKPDLPKKEDTEEDDYFESPI
jgi:hypothetical protein